VTSRPRLLAIFAGAALVGLVLFFWPRARATPARNHARPAPTVAAEPAPAEAPAPDAHAQARQARDAMRERIVEAIRRREGKPAPAVATVAAAAVHHPPPASDEDLPRGHYDTEYIRQNFREMMFPILKQCYDAALKQQPTLRGKLVLNFRIVGDPDVGGVVDDASIADDSTLKDSEMETCARESLLALTFDKPPSGGGVVTVRYPIAFAPGDDDEAEAGAPDGG